MVGGQQVDGDRPIILLHALIGIEWYQTMRVQGKIKNQTVVILVDTGSTHNFMDQLVVRKVGWNI